MAQLSQLVSSSSSQTERKRNEHRSPFVWWIRRRSIALFQFENWQLKYENRLDPFRAEFVQQINIKLWELKSKIGNLINEINVRKLDKQGMIQLTVIYNEKVGMTEMPRATENDYATKMTPNITTDDEILIVCSDTSNKPIITTPRNSVMSTKKCMMESSASWSIGSKYLLYIA